MKVGDVKKSRPQKGDDNIAFRQFVVEKEY